MDQTEPLNDVVQPDTATPAVNAAGTSNGSRSMEYLLREAALRDLKATERQRYAAENAEDRATENRMRHELNAANDARRAQEWDMAVERELASARRRADWLEAHNKTLEAKKACRAAQKAWRDEYRPYENEQRARMRHEREAAESDWNQRRRSISGETAIAYAQRHEAWIDAHQVTVEAKRRMRAALKEERAARKAARPAALAEADRVRTERNALEEARDEAIRNATKERAVATALRRDAEKTGTYEQARAARAREAELRAIEVELITSIREQRCIEEDQRVAARTQLAGERALAYAALREEWLAAKDAEAVEHRKMRAADRLARAAERGAMTDLNHRIRAERQAREEADRLASDELNSVREMKLVELQEAYLDALAAERAEWQRAMQIDKPAREADLAAEREVSAQHRAQREADEAAFKQAVWDMAKERGYARAMEREAARESASDVYRQVRQERAIATNAANAAANATAATAAAPAEQA